jgi:hypothetical protein
MAAENRHTTTYEKVTDALRVRRPRIKRSGREYLWNGLHQFLSLWQRLGEGLTRITHKLAGRNEQTPTMPELRSLLAIQPRNRAHECAGHVGAACGNTLRDLVPAYVNNPA